MSNSVIFDAVAFVKRGVDVGFPREHAEWLAQEQIHSLETNLATKADIEGLRKDTTTAIDFLRKDTKAVVLEATNKLIKWFVGALFLSAGLVIAAVTILLPVIINSLK